MGEKNNIPQIRFKEFEGKWKSAEMNKVAEFSKGHSYSKKDLVKEGKPIILYGRLYTNYESTISDVDTFAIEKPGSKYSNGSEVIVPASGETAEDIAIASVVLKPDIILGGDLNIIYPNELIDSVFLALTISHGKQHKELSKKAQGKSIVHLRNSDIKETTLFYTGKDEQSKIGTYFQNLDKLITLQQQKHDKLVTLKKAMLDKMFPKEGADVPEIRFKGFAGVWEERKLGEISESYSGGTPSVGISEFYNGNIPFIRSAEINCNSTELYITELGLRNSSAKLVNGGCILYALYGATSGEVGRSKLEGAINQAILAIKPSTGIDAEFITQWLRKKKKVIISTYLQGGQGNLSGSIVKNLNINLPCFEEQSQIGSYFQNLDKLISLHQQEIQKLKNIKKACLEKMFV
jgi:type I restriction enzyme S subunit